MDPSQKPTTTSAGSIPDLVKIKPMQSDQTMLAGDKIHNGITTTAGASPLGNRRIGFDTHFSAYGVDAVLLWNGYDNVNWPSSGSLDEVYLGANNPSVSFDNSHARFTVSQLHTAREQINTASAGTDAGEKQT
eukprot:COSAG06_NODE_2734_length_6368_cov_44.250439_9_plen_133_part_00